MTSGAGDGLIWVAVGLGLAAIVSFAVQMVVQRREPENNVGSVLGVFFLIGTAWALVRFLA